MYLTNIIDMRFSKEAIKEIEQTLKECEQMLKDDEQRTKRGTKTVQR